MCGEKEGRVTDSAGRIILKTKFMEIQFFLMASMMALCFVAVAMAAVNIRDPRPVTGTGILILLIIITALVLILFYKSLTV